MLTPSQMPCQNRPITVAFTMIEMLIVMGIMATLMGMGIGAWIGTAERAQSMASQELVLSFIQQARNRSYAQERPIVLHFNNTDNSITGIEQTYLWKEDFDWPSTDTPNYVMNPDSLPIPVERSFGQTGYAWRYPYGAPGSLQQLYLKPFNCTQTDKTVGAEAYLPLFNNELDGFILNVSFQAPKVESAQSTQIPLILLTKKGTSDSVAQSADAIAGIELWKVGQYINDGGTAQKIGDAWALIAWVHKRPDYPIIDGSNPESVNTWEFLDYSTEFTRDLHSGIVTENKNVIPYIGGTWMSASLAFDNNALFLFRDNVRVDTNTQCITDNGFVPTLNQEIDIYVGRHTLPDSLFYVTEADIDNASLISIGSSNQQFLSGNLGPKDNYKMIIDSGIITCYNNNVEVSTLTFINTTTNVESFNILIDGDSNTVLEEINPSQVSPPP